MRGEQSASNCFGTTTNKLLLNPNTLMLATSQKNDNGIYFYLTEFILEKKIEVKGRIVWSVRLYSQMKLNELGASLRIFFSFSFKFPSFEFDFPFLLPFSYFLPSALIFLFLPFTIYFRGPRVWEGKEVKNAPGAVG